MVGVMTLYQSTIGKKVIMAVTGLMLIGFVFFHMYGNLKVFSGPEVFNAYAEGLRTVGYPIFGKLHLLTIARIGLLGAFGLHIWSAIELSRQRQISRPIGYADRKNLKSNYAALTIRWGGTVIALFVIYHLLHLTFGVVHPDFDGHNAYHNVVVGFQSWVVIIYFIALIALGLHLYHATWSMFQTLGFNKQSYETPLRLLGLGLATVVTGGFSLVPLAVLTGIVQ
ncbi:MAG: succinate dehydrogenase cytochrome b subunit [Chloroflexota bacterium]